MDGLKNNGDSGKGRQLMKSFKINNNGVPVWIQIRRRLIYYIVSGQFLEGEQLPTVRELASELGINYNTVNKVYQDLERDGYIVTKRGKGTFVAELDKHKLCLFDNKIELLADELVREAYEFGMTGKEIIAIVTAHVAQIDAATRRNSRSKKAGVDLREERHVGSA